jgi:hypothetical protein
VVDDGAAEDEPDATVEVGPEVEDPLLAVVVVVGARVGMKLLTSPPNMENKPPEGLAVVEPDPPAETPMEALPEIILDVPALQLATRATRTRVEKNFMMKFYCKFCLEMDWIN